MRNIILLGIALISFLMHLEHFPKELVSIHVWRQTQTQSTINNFYEEDMNILNPRRNDRGDGDGIFRMEFPLMQWMVAALYKLFGPHMIISRGFMFLLGLLTMMGMYTLLQVLFRQVQLSLAGAWALTFSPSFFYYTINPLPDNMALAASVWGLAVFFTWTNSRRMGHLILSGLFLSIGTLCKLPFITYYIVPVIYFGRLLYRKKQIGEIIPRSLAIFTWAVLPLAWYISVIPHWHGNPIVEGMLNNQESFSKLLEYLVHNLISTLPELLLNYGSLPLFLAGFYFLFKRRAYKDPRFTPFIGLSLLLILYFLFELNAIAKIHDYYLFPFIPLLFILVAYGAWHLLNSGCTFLRWFTIFLLAILPLTCYLRMESRWDNESPGFNSDLLKYKTELRSAVPNDALVVAGNDKSRYIFFYYIDKKGWSFDQNNLTPEKLKKMIAQGAAYLYTDSEQIISKEGVNKYLDELVVEKGSIKVYRLQTFIPEKND